MSAPGFLRRRRDSYLARPWWLWLVLALSCAYNALRLFHRPQVTTLDLVLATASFVVSLVAVSVAVRRYGQQH